VYGGIEIQGNITENVLTMLQKGLLKNRLFLLDESESAQIDKLIKTIIEIIHYSELLPKTNFADSVIKKFTSNGDHIGKVFTEVMGVSIQKFIDLQKIERVKELLLFEDLSLSAIAELLDYKSKTNLSVQFKKITGLNLTYFRQIKKEREKLAKV
jgi:YesN/AraC family two-component response regulator